MSKQKFQLSDHFDYSRLIRFVLPCIGTMLFTSIYGIVDGSFKCDIVTPAEKLAACEVEMVVVPGVEGEMGFLAGHAPLVSVLADGEIRLTPAEGGPVQRYEVKGGYVQVTDDKVIKA